MTYDGINESFMEITNQNDSFFIEVGKARIKLVLFVRVDYNIRNKLSNKSKLNVNKVILRRG